MKFATLLSPGYLRHGCALLLGASYLVLSLTAASAAGPLAPSNLRGSVVTSTSFNIIWDDNSTDETTFEMLYAVNGGSENTANLGAGASTGTLSTGFSVTGWNSATIRIRATNASGSTYSNTVTLTFNTAYNPPASPLVKTQPDGSFLVMWTDNASTEAGYSIEYATASGGPFSILGSTPGPNYTGIYTGSLAPSTTYYFRIRGFQGTPQSQTNYSAYIEVSGTTPSTLLAPTALSVSATNETSLSFNFTDNTALNNGYEIEYSPSGTGQFAYFGETGDYGSVTASNSALPGTAYDFRVRAFYESAPGSRVYSGYSNTHSVTTPFYAPTALTATAVSASQVNLAWTNHSAVQQGVSVYYRVTGSGNYTRVGYAGPADTTYPVTGLSAGTTYDFQVAAAYESSSSTVIESTRSNVATASTAAGFSSRSYEPITYNQSFSYRVTVGSLSPRTGWEVTDLPAGLNFNESTGEISGIPGVVGVYTCPMRAWFADGSSVSSTLTLRIIRAPGAPETTSAISTQTIANGGNTSVALSDKFSDPDAESAVRLTTNLGTMDFILYNTATPQTVANFLAYVNNASSAGNYNGAVFHRSVSGFVVQGGGFKVASAPDKFTSIPKLPSPVNEPGISNVRGTVAMAKVGSDPNSASNQFFVNLANSSGHLDNLNGGFTVFGRVAGSGMDVADAIARLPTVSTLVTVDGTPTDALTDWPLTGSSGSMNTALVVSILSAAPVPTLVYSVTGNTNPAAVTAEVSNGNLLLTGLAGGQSNVTVTATDLDGNAASQTFAVNVTVAPAFTSAAPASQALKDAVYQFTCTASGFPAPDFTLTAGALPDGLTLDPGGVISGTPTSSGIFTGTVTATNAAGSATQNFSIAVNQPPAFTSAAPGSAGEVGSPYDFTCTASGYPNPTFSVTAGALPAGLSLSSNGIISGSATVAGNFTGMITAGNSAGIAMQSFSITVTLAPSSWAAGKNLSGNDALLDADPDHDGRSNLHEFAFLTEPASSDSGEVPSLSLAIPGVAKYAQITFPIRKFAPTLTYVVMASDSLASDAWVRLWASSDGFSSPVVVSAVEQSDCTVVTVRDTQPSPPATRRFLRVEVTAQEGP